MISRGFFKSSVIYSVVGALPYASGFLLLPWFTALLTPEQFGINALYIALMYFIQILTSFGMDMSVGVLYFDYRDQKEKLKEFLGTAFISIAMLGTATLLLFSMGGMSLFNLVFKSSDFLELIPFGMFTILSGVMNSIFKVYSNLLINQQRPGRFLWINLVNFALTISLSLLILYQFPYTLYGPILGRLLPAIVSATLSLALIGSEYGLNWNRTYLKKLFEYSTPIMIYALLTWVISYIDRFLILRFMGDATKVGIYDIAVKIVIGLDLIMAGLVNTVNPKAYSIWKARGISETTPEINRYYNGITAFFLLLIPLFVLLTPVLIPLVIFKPLYYEAFVFLPILAAGYLTRVWFYMYMAPILFFRKTSALPRVFLISAVFNILLAAVMIHFFGLMGAVVTNFLVKPVQALLMYLECRKIYTFRVNRFKIYLAPAIYIVIAILCQLFIPGHLWIYTGLGQLAVAFILVFVAFRNEIKPFLLMLRAGKTG